VTSGRSHQRLVGATVESVSNTTKPRPEPLDLSQFSSVEDAIDKMVEAEGIYIDLAKRVFKATWPDLHSMTLFIASAIKRAMGLHRGVVSGVRESNPHAAFPLLRGYIELVILVAYVLHNPRYIRAAMTDPAESPPGVPKRKSIQSLIGGAEKEFPTIKAPYDELSDMGHFGTVALWSAFKPDELEQKGATMTIEWTNAPSWRDADDPLKAAAHLLEFVEAFAQTVDKITLAHLAPLSPSGDQSRGAHVAGESDAM
jgi:hypothetical protein